MTLTEPADQDIVVFGVSGDLAARKLLPALYNLAAQGLLSQRGDIVGVAPMPWDDEALRAHAHDAVARFSRTGLDEAVWQRAMAPRLRFVPPGSGGSLDTLRTALHRDRRLTYLAVPSSAFIPLVDAMRAAKLDTGTSLIIEKPFGRDLESARTLNAALHSLLPEERIFRIDHYMGKETVQNLLVVRFGNTIFERLWNRDCIASVEITVAEDIGVEQRGHFYEETGALRDIVQNHLMQLLAVVAMEPPASFTPEALRAEKAKVLDAVRAVDPAHVVRGQYTAGTIDGQAVPGYREEPGVAPDSTTETYAALRVSVDTWRWSGVPFLLRTGKRLAARETHIVIVFHEVPLHLFHGTVVDDLDQNILVIRVQPEEGISARFVAKCPGPQIDTQPVRMDFCYGTSFMTSPPEAYERLLHDALLGDHTLFIGEQETERGWAILQPVLDAPPPLHMYPAGSCGPEEAEGLAAPDRWHVVEGAE